MGFKAGDIIGVYLNMDMNTLKFSVNGASHGEAFDSIDLNEKDDINGYRLAISLQHRPHKLTLLESTLYNVERRSPRPNNNTFGNGGGHQRKLSYSTMNNKRKGTAGTISDDAKSDEVISPKQKVSKKKKSSKKSLDSNLSPSKIKKKGKKKSDKVSTASSKKKKGAKKKKKKSETVLTASKKKSKGAKTKSVKKKEKKSSSPSKKKAKSNKKSKEEKKENEEPKKKKSKKSDSTNWTKRESAKKDKWDECGPKLNIEKSSVSTKTNIKDGNSSFGKLSVKGKMKTEWVVTIKQGDNIAIGICNVVGGLKTNKNKRLLTQSFTNDIGGYGYMGNDGGIQRSGRYKKYGKKFKAGDKVSVVLDTKAKTLSFTLNGEDQGVAFKNLPSGEYRLAAAFFEKSQKIILNKTTIWDAGK